MQFKGMLGYNVLSWEYQGRDTGVKIALNLKALSEVRLCHLLTFVEPCNWFSQLCVRLIISAA